MRRPLSLATRLTIFFGIAAALVFPIFGWIISGSIDQHFEESDTAELEIIADAVGRFGSQTALGNAIGLSPTRISRVLKGDGCSLEVISCLRLAEVTGESPTVILRAAGKWDVAELIERLYGKPRPVLIPRLSESIANDSSGP